MLDWLRGQESVFVPEENRRRQVQLIDFERGLEPGRNVFQVTPEWAFKKKWRKGNRPDIVFSSMVFPLPWSSAKPPSCATPWRKPSPSCAATRRKHRKC